MSEWYDVQVRGILGCGKRDVREMETLGRSLRWTDARLEYEANDKQRQTLMEGMGLCKGSRAVNSGRGSEAWQRH